MSERVPARRPAPTGDELERRLTNHLRAWLGAWPPEAGFHLASSPARDHAGWDGEIRRFAAVSTPVGTVASLPETLLAPARELLAARSVEGFLEGVPELVGARAGGIRRGVFRYVRELKEFEPAGEWIEVEDERVPAWLSPFGGRVLVALDDDGRYLGGVGRKRHDEHAHELAVGVEPTARNRGLARRLVAQAARAVVDEGLVATYLHASDNAASAAVADAAGFPDLGWAIIGVA